MKGLTTFKFFLFFLGMGIFFPCAVEAQSQEVNAILGDSSWLAKHHSLPDGTASEKERISTHLAYVVALLQNAVPPADAHLAEKRREMISALDCYVQNAVYPRQNRDSTVRLPCFVDDEGRLCAVAHLINTSGNAELVQKINAKYRFNLLADMHDAELIAWQEQSGLALRELAMIQPSYDFYPVEVAHPTMVYQDPETGLLGVMRRKDGKKLTPARYSEMEMYLNPLGYGKAKKEGQWAIIDDKGRAKTPFVYEQIQASLGTETSVFIVNQNGRFYLLSDKGKRQGKEQYDEILLDNFDFLRVRQGSRWGMMNTDGKLFIPLQYEQLIALSPEFFLALLSGKSGLLNQRGEVLIPFEYDRIEAVKVGWRAQIGQEIHLYTNKGEQSKISDLEALYPYGNSFHDGEMLGKQSGNYGLINGSLEWSIPPMHDTIIRYIDFHVVQKDGLWGYYNNSHQLLLPIKYSHIGYTLSGFVVREEGKMGLLNLQGQPVVPVNQDSVYRLVRNLSGGLNTCYAVARADGWEVVNQDGERISQKAYPSVSRLWNDLILLEDDDRFYVGYYYNNQLHVYEQHPFERIEEVTGWNGSTIIKQDGKFGLIRLYNHQAVQPGAMLAEAVYDSLFKAPVAHLFVAELQGKYGLMNSEGQLVLPIQCEAVHPKVIAPRNVSQMFILFYCNGEKVLIDAYGKKVSKEQAAAILKNVSDISLN